VIVDLQTDEEAKIPANIEYSDLLVPIFRKGELIYQLPTLAASRECARQQLSRLPPEIVRLDNPRAYRVGLEKSLHELRSVLISRASEQQSRGNEDVDNRRSSE
jgi:nicotinate phosphoribosyltransferase